MGAGLHRLVRFVTCLLLCGMFAFCGGPALAGERVSVELTDGSRVEGEVLKKDEQVLYISVGGEVISLDRKKVKKLESSGGEESLEEVETRELYRTAELPARAVSALVEQFGAAIVVVRTPAGLGTGWFCDPDGYVVTNNHVVANERTISVTAFKRQDGRFEKKVYKKVKIVALDEHLDLALLKVEEDLGMEVPQLDLGDSTELKEGDEVFTIGNPMGMERSVGRGDVSKVNRNYQGRLYVQTTTPIAPGNSGGPLFNERGEVIGVVNMGYIFLDGLGFAIPSQYVKEFLDNVEAYAYDPDNPNSGVKYMETPLTATDGSMSFTASEFVKVDHGISSLVLEDINSDGVREVIFVNNRKGEIGVLRRRGEKEPVEDVLDYEDINRLPPSRLFKLDTHAVNNKITSLAVEDLNDDGRPDILFHGDIDGLAVMEQQEDGSFGEPRKLADVEVARRTDALEVVDMDGDGRKEIFALGTSGFSVVGEAPHPETYPLDANYSDKLGKFVLTDVNGDGRRDVMLFGARQFYAATVLLQNPEGGFVEELLIPAHVSGPVVELHGGAGAHRFLTLDVGRNRVRRMELATERLPAREGHLDMAPHGLVLESETAAEGDLEFADLDSDGDLELITAIREKNEFVTFQHTKQGWLFHTSPAPKNVSGVKLYRTQEGKVVLYSFSTDDKIFGVSRVEADHITFPRPINTEGLVQFIWLGDINGAETLLWVERVDREYHIRTVPAKGPARKVLGDTKGSIDVEPASLTFGEEGEVPTSVLPGKPARLAFADFNGDGLSDLVLYWSYSGKESLYLGRSDGKYETVIKDQEFLEQQGDQPLLVADVDADGSRDVLLVQPGFVRVLRVDEKGKLYVERQFNWEFGEIDRLVPYGEAEPPRFLALSGHTARVVRFNVKESTFEHVAKLDLTGLNVGRIHVRDLDGNGEPEVVAASKNTIMVLYRGGERRTFRSRIVFDARTDYFKYWDVRTFDLDGDGGDELLLFDSQKAMLEIHRPDEDGELRPICRRRLFEKSIHQRGDSDSFEMPKEMAAGDVDGDGRNDMVMVLQDRLAIYMQGEPVQEDAGGGSSD